MESTKNNPAGGSAAADKSEDSAPLAAGVGAWVDHDHGNEHEARLVSRVEELADMLAALEHQRPATDEERLEVLAAVTSTPKGKSIRGLRGAPRKWVEESLRACDAFEADNMPGHEPGEEE
jgi:hypothetical protein